jgi:hypothetical protein
LVITKKGINEIPGLTDIDIPRRLGPKRANKIRKLFEMQEGFNQLSTIYYVNNLRNKLSLVGGDAFQISLIKNQGYRFDMKVTE